MADEGKKNKNGIELDWNRLLGEEGNQEEEEEPHQVQLVNEKSESEAVAAEFDEEQSHRNHEFRNLPEKDLRERIERNRSLLRSTGARLKDGGDKLRSLIKDYEDELERRCRLPVQKVKFLCLISFPNFPIRI